MSLCYFNCNRCGREDRSSFFHETKCSCGGWYIRQFWVCRIGHRNDPSNKECHGCRERYRENNRNRTNNNNTYNRKNNDEDLTFCNCFGSEEPAKKEDEDCIIF